MVQQINTETYFGYYITLLMEKGYINYNLASLMYLLLSVENFVFLYIISNLLSFKILSQCMHISLSFQRQKI